MPYAIAVVPTNTSVNRRIRENNDLEEDCDAEVGAVVPLSVAARETLCFAPFSLAMVPIVRFRICNAAMYLILRVQCIWSRDSSCNVSVSSPQFWTNVQPQRTINFQPQSCSLHRSPAPAIRECLTAETNA